MKKIFLSAMLLMGGLCAFTSCEDDNDSNPIVQQPEEGTFVLNQPAFTNEVIDLSHSETLHFSWSQPDYGFPVVAAYYYQISLTGNFTHSVEEAEADETGSIVADYVTGDAGVSDCAYDFSAADIAKSIQQLAQWESDEVPAEQTIYFRILSNIPVSGGVAEPVNPIASNVVSFKVVPYFIELSDAPVEMWYLIGSCVGDGAWTNDPSAIGTSLVPMNVVDGYEYDKKTGRGELTFTGYLTTAGFKLVHTLASNWPDQWGQGASFGDFVKNDGGSGNITVPADGYYTITLNTLNDKLTVEAADVTPTVYPSMLISGDFNGWGVTTEMTPVNTVVANNHIWSFDLDATGGATTAKFLQNDSWQPNWGGSAFPNGTGGSDGPNIPVEPGHYTVIFNDVTGAYNFIAK